MPADEPVVGNRNDHHDRFHPSDHTKADSGHDPGAGRMADTGCFLFGFGADLTVTVSIMVGLNKRLAQLDELRTSMRTVSDSMSEMLGESALQTQQKVDENKVQAALARAELRDIAEERRRELQDRVQERRKEKEEYLRKLEETLHKQLTSGRVFAPRRLQREFTDSKHMRYGELWKLLSEEINGKKEE